MDDTVRQYVENQRLRSPAAPTERAPPAREPARGLAGMDIDIAGLLRLVWRSKGLLAICLVVIPAAALFLASKETPLYTAMATIIHEPDGDVPLGPIEGVFAEQESNESVLGTQIEVLRSQAVAEAVIDRLALKDHPAFNPALMEPSLADRLRGYVREAIGLVIALFEAPEPEALGGGEGGAEPDREQITLLGAFNDGLGVAWLRGTFVIQVFFTSPDPILAADIVNAVVDAHVTSQLEAKYQAFTRISSWIDERVGELQGNVLEAERAVERFRQESGLTEGVSSTLLTEQISSLNGALADAQARAAASQSVLDQVRGAANVTEALQSLPEVYSTDLIRDLRVQQAQLRRDEAQLSSTLAAQHPSLIEVRSKLARIDSVIVEETDRIRRGLETEAATDRIRVSELQRGLDTLRAQIAATSGAGADLGSLERDATAQRNLLETMLRVSQETAGQYSLARAEARPLSRATVPLWPSFPNLTSVLAVSLVFALLVGLALVVLKELLNTTLRGTDEVEERLGIRCIATVPRISRRDGLDRVCATVWRKPFSKFAETIRQVRAHLLLDGRQPSTVVVTSALPREGKTTTAVSLARAAAMSGERVILLDCDVRRAAVGKALGCDEAVGLTQLLRGEYTANEVVRTDEPTGLHVIPAGDFAANSSRLFYSREMVSLIESLRLQYDLVVLDAPPLFAVSDAPLLAAIADAVVLCVKWRGTSRRLASHAVRTLREAGARPIGVVLTQVDLRAYRATGYSDSPVHDRRNDGYYYG